MIPLHPAAVVTAVISAVLFTAALVYLIRYRSAPIETTLADALAGEGQLLDREIFASVLLERRFNPLGPLVSLVWHAVIIAGTPLLPYLFTPEVTFDARRYHVRMMEFRIPAPLLYTPPPKQGAAPAARMSMAVRMQPAGASARAARRDPGRYALEAPNRPRLQLPLPLRAPSRDAVIQPDESPQISIAPQPLPSAFLWAQAPAPIDLSRVVGAKQTPRPTFSLPRSTPGVQRPNRELMVSDLQIGAAPILSLRLPRLPVRPANVSPVRVPSANEAVGELPATALPSGDPMNLIALMRSPAPPAFGYLLLAGNLLAGFEANGEPGAPAAQAGAAGGDGPGGNSLSGKGTHADLLSASGSGAAAGAGPGAEGSGATGAAASDTRAKAPAQPATTGNLGIIIVQPSSQESVLDGGDTLTGQPVYTVYFDVPGAPRRWVLQYCVAGSVSQPSTETSPEGVIRILPKRTVQPPYPIERIPVDVKGVQSDARRLVLYAMVNERGETENVRVIRGVGSEIDSAAVAILKRWAFRPAMRGDSPVAVEALFGIPLQ